MASRSIDSRGLSSLRLTVQHSGGRSPGRIVPVRRWLATVVSTRLSHSGSLACSPEAMQLLLRSGWPEQELHRFGRAGQGTGVTQPGQEERHEFMQVLDVLAERGKLHGAREELQQAGHVGVQRAAACRERNPELF